MKRRSSFVVGRSLRAQTKAVYLIANDERPTTLGTRLLNYPITKLPNYPMASDRIVGIDLGTTNSLVAFMQGEVPVIITGEDGSNLVPSVVAPDENEKIDVGIDARTYPIETAERAVA